jgi:AcrR family transcriptional regulator/transposase-like protein
MYFLCVADGGDANVIDDGLSPAEAKRVALLGDDECLDWLWRHRFSADGTTADCPQCVFRRRFHRIRSRRSYACDNCGHQLYPTAGTLFGRSSTPLVTWFRAADLMLHTGGTVTAREIQRRFQLEYRTALRVKSRLVTALADSVQSRMLNDGFAALFLPVNAGSHLDAVDPRTRAKMNRIRVATSKVFARRGFAYAHVADVAAESGVSSAFIHHHFRTKDALLRSAMLWNQEQGARRLRELMRRKRGVRSRLEGLVDLALPTSEAIRDEYLLWLDAWSRSRGGQRFDEDQMFSGWHETVVNVVRDGQAEGVFLPHRAPEDFADAFVSLADGLSFKVVQKYEEMPLTRAQELLWNFVEDELGLRST